MVVLCYVFFIFSITCEGRDTITCEGRVFTHSNAFECVANRIYSGCAHIVGENIAKS